MDITIQNVRSPALEHNGRYYKVFQPRTANELLKLHHMGCVGDTVLTDIQIEQGDFPTNFVEPTITQRALAGIFKDMRSIELELRDQNSTLWGKIQQNNQGALTQFFNTNVKSAIAQTASEIRQEVRDAANSARVQVNSNGVTIGATTVTGKQLASTISTSSEAIDLIAPKIRVQSNMIVDGSVTASKMAAGSIRAEHISSGAITADKIEISDALINKIVARDILADKIASKQIFATKIESIVSSSTFLQAYQGEIGGFTIGRYPGGSGRWISGINTFSVGMGNGGSFGENRTAFWANWGSSWDHHGPDAWFVTSAGKMYCFNTVDFHDRVDFSNTATVNFYTKLNATSGIWTGNGDIHGNGSNPAGGDNAVCWWNQITTAKWRGYAGITSSSDKRLKENIEETKVKALDKIKALDLVSFNFIKDKKHEEIGLIAQEVQKVVPEAVEVDDETSYLSINYGKFVPYLLKAVQELTEKVCTLEET